MMHPLFPTFKSQMSLWSRPYRKIFLQPNVLLPKTLAQTWIHPELLASQTPRLNARTEITENEDEVNVSARYTNLCDDTLRLIGNMTFIKAGNPTFIPDETRAVNILIPTEWDIMYRHKTTETDILPITPSKKKMNVFLTGLLSLCEYVSES